jgi:hypothetical protein
VAWSIVHVVVPPAGTPRSRAAVQASVLLAVSALGTAAVGVYFAATGRWTDLWATLVVHNRYYAGPLLPNLREGMRLPRLFPSFLRDVAPCSSRSSPASFSPSPRDGPARSCSFSPGS